MRALEVRLGELGLRVQPKPDGDRTAELRASLLYELAEQKQRAHTLGMEVATLTDALRQAREDYSTLLEQHANESASRAAAEQREYTLQNDVHQQRTRAEGLDAKVTKLSEEKQQYLCLIEELNDKKVRWERAARASEESRIKVCSLARSLAVLVRLRPSSRAPTVRPAGPRQSERELGSQLQSLREREAKLEASIDTLRLVMSARCDDTA